MRSSLASSTISIASFYGLFALLLFLPNSRKNEPFWYFDYDAALQAEDVCRVCSLGITSVL